MSTIRVDQQSPDPAAIEQAAAVLRAGGLVAFPTETVYGLGANALDSEAVARIFAAKGRPSYNPLIVHVHDAAVA
nr:Sua5/YciO/YrdC/YwlC family protein [Gemmatimonadota bacterium]